MKLKILLFFFIFSIFSSSVFAKPRCDIFYEKIKSDYDVLKLEQEKITEIKSMGFDLQVIFDKFHPSFDSLNSFKRRMPICFTSPSVSKSTSLG